MERADLELYTEHSWAVCLVLSGLHEVCNQWDDAASQKETEKAFQKKEVKYKLKVE